MMMTVSSYQSCQSLDRPGRRTPPARLLICGRVPSAADFLVRYVDEDASGEPRLIELVPERPARARRS